VPLMSEGKNGPSPAKLRAIWRTMKRRHDEQAAYIALRAKLGRPPSALADETAAIVAAFLAGESIPVGIIPAAWRETCARMNAQEAAALAGRPTEEQPR
jgi:hypothetical protein